MPRKPKLPIPITVEALSTGREVRPEFIIDELTGEPKPVVQDARPVRYLPTSEDMQAGKHRADLKSQQARAKRIEHSFKLALDLVAGKVSAKEPEPTHREVKLGDHIALIPLPPKKPFRRL